MNKKVEILSPAGSFESFVAAINAGADAIYLGGQLYGARAYANNFSKEELVEAIKYAHIYGVKVYLTINTLFKDDEIDNLFDYLLPYYEMGLDAVIVQDLGVLKYVKENFPGLDIHASTQMSLTGRYGGAVLKAMGASRIVTAREISLKEIKEISENVDIEIESFVHGAMCYCYSGQCLLSSFIGGRSGNRGRCAQACRLPYTISKNTSYYMSLKDMCTLEILPDIIEAGVFSLKIEGRMKSPQYTAGVVSMYRKYVDMYEKYGREGYKVDEKDIRVLMDLYNRGNFTTGYYTMHNSPEMMADDRPNHQGVLVGKVIRRRGNEVELKVVTDINSMDILDVKDKFDYTIKDGAKAGERISLRVSKESKLNPGDDIYRTRNNALIDDITSKFITANKKLEVKGSLLAKVNQKAKLTVNFNGRSVMVESAQEVSKAQKQPVDETSIRKQLNKTGATKFYFGKLEIDMDNNIFFPMREFNELRRQALERLEECIVSENRRETPIKKESLPLCETAQRAKQRVSVLLDDDSRAQELVGYEEIERVYIELSGIDFENFEVLTKVMHDNGKQIYIALPYIFREKSKKLFGDVISKNCVDGYLVRNLEEYGYLKEVGNKSDIIFDYNVYEFNRYAKEVLSKELQGETTCSVELNATQLEELGLENSELIVYGYLPMMISAQCFVKNTTGCRKIPGLTDVTDRCNNHFYVKNDCKNCYNIIYNSSPLVLYDKPEEIEQLSPKRVRVMISQNDMDNIHEILSDVLEGKKPKGNITRGHFLRGVM